MATFLIMLAATVLCGSAWTVIAYASVLIAIVGLITPILYELSDK